MVEEVDERVLNEADGGEPEALMTELCSKIDQFNTVWPSCSAKAVVFRIPFYPDGLVPERVEPERVIGDEALELCSRAYRGFSRPPDQHPGSVYRLPGYVVLDRLLLDEIDEINALKAQLQASIKSLCANERARNTFCRQHFPGRVMLQVYRQIPTARAPIEALRFSWSPATSAVRKLSKAQAIDALQSRLGSGLDGVSDDRRNAILIAIEKVRVLNSQAQVIVQKPRSPYPIATLFHTRGRGADKAMVALSLPVFIGPGVNEEPVDIGDLAAYDKLVRRSTRSDQKHSESLYMPLYMRIRYNDVGATTATAKDSKAT